MVAFLAEIAGGAGGFDRGSGSVIDDFGLCGPAVADGEWYRLVTGGFLHAGLDPPRLQHVRPLLPRRDARAGDRHAALRRPLLRLAARRRLRRAAALDPTTSRSAPPGAVFGIFGAAFVIARGRGLEQIASQIGLLLVINLAFTFGVPGISIGGHLGGLVGGVLCALVIVAGERGMLGPAHGCAVELAAMAAIGVASPSLGALASPSAGAAQLGEADAARRARQVGVEQVAEQLDAVDQARAGPREGRGGVDREDAAGAERARSAPRCRAPAARGSSTYQPQGIDDDDVGAEPRELPPADLAATSGRAGRRRPRRRRSRSSPAPSGRRRRAGRATRARSPAAAARRRPRRGPRPAGPRARPAARAPRASIAGRLAEPDHVLEHLAERARVLLEHRAAARQAAPRPRRTSS